MKKSVFAIAMAALLTFSLAGCGKENSDGNDPEDNTPGGGSGGTVQDFTPYDESLRIADTRTLTPQEYTAINLVATDDYGRALLSRDGKENDDRYVGLFYFLWLGQNAESTMGIYDMSEITENGTALENFQTDNRTTPLGAAHFWGKPVWGYYNSRDEWVMRKQVEMLTLAGVDFLVFDCTNGFTYPQTTGPLFAILKEYQDAGWNVPKIMYYLAADNATHTQYMQTLKQVYNEFYAKEEYRSLWFMPDGKPIITMPTYYYYHADGHHGFDLSDPVESTLNDLFEFKLRQWPNEGYLEDGIPWMEFTPNALYDFQPNHNGWMNVSVAQHVTIRFSDVYGTQGRGFDHWTLTTDHARFGEDLNYISQWQTVLDYKDEVRFTFLTGWNEWIATKFVDGGGEYFTVDTFIPEFSRDLEPSENLGDNSYLLTAEKIRQNNYTEAKHYVYPETTIDIGTDDPKWESVPTYLDFTNDCLDRNYQAMAGRDRYTDTSGRNDIASVKVARDKTYLYFRIETVEDITPHTEGDTGWMNLWIRTQNAKNSYMGYNYVIGRSVSEGHTDIYRANASSVLEKAGSGDMRYEGNKMFVRVALADLGLGGADYDIEFKVTDNVSETSYLDFYRTGDSAPIGRLNYKFGY